jgi:hypothetical protein
VDLIVDSNQPVVVDIGPLCPHDTSAVLFTWDELDALNTDHWPLRIIESEQDCRLSIYRTKFGPVELENMDSFDLGDQFQFLYPK